MSTIRRMAQSRVGGWLDQWRLDELIDVGGMGAVFAATHADGSRAAVKLLRHELGPETEAHKRFLREARAANMVAHRGAVDVIAQGVDRVWESPFMVMELLDGRTLDAQLQSGGVMAPHEVLAIAGRVLDVLTAAHAVGIIHRDIKPGNIFLERNGGVKIFDFGFARVREAAVKERTSDGMVIGTVSFMAPEQARAKTGEIDHRCDLWSLGATMFTSLTGRNVHEGSMIERLTKTMSQPAPPLCSVLADAPVAVAAVVDRALALEREDRWPDAASMRTALREAFGSLQRDAPIPLTRVNRRR